MGNQLFSALALVSIFQRTRMYVDGNKIDVSSTLNSISRKKGGRGAAVRGLQCSVGGRNSKNIYIYFSHS